MLEPPMMTAAAAGMVGQSIDRLGQQLARLRAFPFQQALERLTAQAWRELRLTARQAARLWAQAEPDLAPHEREARGKFRELWSSTGLPMPFLSEEAYALFQYTYDSASINRTLRGLDKNRSYMALAKLVASALNNLPESQVRRETQTYRGAHMPRHLVRAYQVGRVVRDRGFLSTTEDKAVAAYRLHRTEAPGYVPVEMTVTSKTGRFIGTAEKEVLFLPQTSFRVNRRYTTPDGVVHIEMTEV